MMSGYFRSWRRKIGIVTLLIACVFALGWMRSRFFADGIHFPSNSNNARIGIVSINQWIAIIWRQDIFSRNWRLPFVISAPFTDFESELGSDFQWYWLFCGFGCGGYPDQTQVLFVPYLSIIVPFTLLSSWLLLLKTRLSKLDNSSLTPNRQES